MWIDRADMAHLHKRRAPRVGFELPVRVKHGLVRSTAMLKDLTTHGARIAGIEDLQIGEGLTLFLPDQPATTAFVVWSEPMSSGLEFATPLGENTFAELVAGYALGQARPAIASGLDALRTLRRAYC